MKNYNNKNVTVTFNSLKRGLKSLLLIIVFAITTNITAQKAELTPKEIAYAKAEFRNGMASFVESIKPIYKTGMTYTSFKSSLLGTYSNKVTSEGEALLNKAYIYLSTNKTSNYIVKNDSGKEIGIALFTVKKYNIKNKTNDGDLVLFGNTTGDTFPSDSILNKVKECRWYQLGCHFSNFWEWLVGGGMDEINDILAGILTAFQILVQMGIFTP